MLKTEHLFKILNVLKKTGVMETIHKLKSEFVIKENATEKEIEVLQSEIGLRIIMEIISNLGKVETEIYDLIASVKGCKPKDIKDQPPLDTMNDLKEIYEDDAFKNIFGFFTK